MEDIKYVIARNLTAYRKMMNLTQLELAEKLNYSDKAVSKWERGESLPDVIILKQIADLYGISIDDFTKQKDVTKIRLKGIQRNKFASRLLICILSICLVWFIAVCSFVLLNFLNYSATGVSLFQSWHCFIFAIPISFIVAVVFSCIWFRWPFRFGSISCLVWTTAVCLDVIFVSAGFTKSYLFYLVCIPIQIIIIFWYLLRYVHKKKDKKHSE